MSQLDPAKMERLLDSERRERMNPDLFLNILEIRPGIVVADVGSGPGFFTLPAAIRVGEAGKVYALDIEPAMLERLRERAAAEGIQNIETLVAQEDKLPLPDAAVDVALIFLVLHECTDRVGMLREVVRVLRPNGYAAVVEWDPEVETKGPPRAERVSSEEMAGYLRAAGFNELEPLKVPASLHGVKARR